MAIFGVGSKWGKEELKNQFFEEGKFILGWNEPTAKDIYSAISTLKVGDILYIKGSPPGSRKIKVKGIGIVSKNFMNCINENEYENVSFSNWESLFIKVEWFCQEEFTITIPGAEGKLTNQRASTFYEEYLPYVQEIIIRKMKERITN
jgi:hypothetical protein